MAKTQTPPTKPWRPTRRGTKRTGWTQLTLSRRKALGTAEGDRWRLNPQPLPARLNQTGPKSDMTRKAISCLQNALSQKQRPATAPTKFYPTSSRGKRFLSKAFTPNATTDAALLVSYDYCSVRGVICVALEYPTAPSISPHNCALLSRLCVRNIRQHARLFLLWGCGSV
jgi:hypothetical protein